MNRNVICLLLFGVLLSCSLNKRKTSGQNFTSVTVDTLIAGKMNCRAIAVDKGEVWYAADQGRIGFYNIITREKGEYKIAKDTLALEFRSIATTQKNVFVLAVGNPALLYKIPKSGGQPELVYQENNDKAFYDSMQFWNDLEGIAIGDPTEECLSIISTKDGGNSWQKTPCVILPKVTEGEAAFAASNTNICIKGNNTWVVTGGKKARMFYSYDKGASWVTYDTPIVQGLAMTGIFTADFYDSAVGVIAGGNYEIPNQNFSNKAITTNGGKTWKLIADYKGFGYASCIQFIPKSNGKGLVCVGTSGMHYSNDSGNTWVKLMDVKDLYTIRFLNETTAITTGRTGMYLLHFR